MFARFRGKGSDGTTNAGADATDAQSARLDLAEKEALIRALSADLEHERQTRRDEVETASKARARTLVKALAPAVVQLELQRALAASGVDVASRDVLRVAERFTATLVAAGLELIGLPGEVVAYDPLKHAPLDATSRPAAGARVRIRIPGANFEGTVVVPAAVEQDVLS